MELSIVDLLKTGGTALVGWIAGRLQAAHADTSARVKTQQEKLVDAIRLLSRQAIEYHCLTLDPQQLVVRAEFLKSDLWRIRSDMQALSGHCCAPQAAWITPCMSLLDAVTAYPFEPAELPPARDQRRSQVISVASEEMVACIAGLRIPLFGKTFASLKVNWFG
jgi:hypothetical protein